MGKVVPFVPLDVPKRERDRVIPGDGVEEVGVARVQRKVGREGVAVGVDVDPAGVERDGVETARRAGERRVTRGVVEGEGSSRVVSSERWWLSTSSLSGRSSAVAVARVRLGAGMVVLGVGKVNVWSWVSVGTSKVYAAGKTRRMIDGSPLFLYSHSGCHGTLRLSLVRESDGLSRA